MSNPTAPSVKLALGGKVYHLRFDFDAIAEAEEITDRPLLTGLRQRDITAPTISLVRAMCYACLHVDHPQMSYEEVKALINRRNLVDVWGKVLEAWTEGMAEPEEDTAAADPTTASLN